MCSYILFGLIVSRIFPGHVTPPAINARKVYFSNDPPGSTATIEKTGWVNRDIVGENRFFSSMIT